MKFLTSLGLLQAFLVITSAVPSDRDVTDLPDNSNGLDSRPDAAQDGAQPTELGDNEALEAGINGSRPTLQNDREESLCAFESPVTGNSGELKSPNFPDNYPDNITCIWTIQAAKGHHTNLVFHHFDLEEGISIPSPLGQYTRTECHFDMLFIAEEYLQPASAEPPSQLVDGSESSNSEPRVRRVIWGVFCGNTMPPPRMTKIPGSKLVLVFRSDHSKTKSGFRATFHSIKPEELQRSLDKRARSSNQKTISDIFDPTYWEMGHAEAARAFMAVVSFITSVFLVVAIIHCCNGSRFCSCVWRGSNRPRSSTSIPSVMMNIFGGSPDGTIRTPTPPPAYGDIVKTDEDWQEALNRMGETNESMARYRSHPDNIQVHYDIIGPTDQPTSSAQAPQRSLHIPMHLPVEQMHDPRGAVTDNFLMELSHARRPVELRRNDDDTDDGEQEQPIATIGGNNSHDEI